MLILTAAQNTQPDYVALAMVLVLAVIVAIMAIRKKMAPKSVNVEVVTMGPTQEEAAPKSTLEAPGSAGQVKLYDVEPKTAAMVMAIVASQTGKSLNELRFISIKEVK